MRIQPPLRALAVAAVWGVLACGGAGSSRRIAVGNIDASPVERDTYYAFLSGGQSGSVFVVGIPSCRILREIPIFEPRAAYGYAMHEGDPRRQELIATGGLWGDTRTPVLSEKDGHYDGRYLWINDLASSRLARVRLDTFQADKIIKIPNLQGANGIATVSPQTRYIVVNGAFEQPTDALATNSEPYTSLVAFVDPEAMEVKFEVRIPGSADTAVASRDGRYSFSTVYNREQGTDVNAMIQFDRDAVAAIDIPAAEKALAGGHGHVRDGVPVLEPEEVPEILTLIPVPKNPHGINLTPDGRYVIASGKLSPTVTIIDVHALKIVAEPEVGLGPFSTTFDDRGNAYTSLLMDSQVVKWNIAEAIRGAPDYIVDRIDMHYHAGHLNAVGAETARPHGDFLLAVNAQSKDLYLPVGPDMPENLELIDISGKKMKMLTSFSMPPEPHDIVFIEAKVLAPQVKQVFPSAPDAVAAGSESVIRTGPHAVTVRMTMVRSAYTPDHFEVREGDRVTLRLTNIETIRNIVHGFGLSDHNLNVSLPPGFTQTVTVQAARPGVYWYYCTNSCGALHLEMRGRMIVQPKDSTGHDSGREAGSEFERSGRR
jgi:nitrous-oxide reductase